MQEEKDPRVNVEGSLLSLAPENFNVHEKEISRNVEDSAFLPTKENDESQADRVTEESTQYTAGKAPHGFEDDIIRTQPRIESLSRPIAAEPKETTIEAQFLNLSEGAEDGASTELPIFDSTGYLQKQRARVYQIQTLKEKIESRPIPSYSEELEGETIDQTAITLAHVNIETLERQQRQIEREQAEAVREEQRKQSIRYRLIREKEEEAKEAVRSEADKAAEVMRP